MFDLPQIGLPDILEAAVVLAILANVAEVGHLQMAPDRVHRINLIAELAQAQATLLKIVHKHS
jgi:hypothetical protein